MTDRSARVVLMLGIVLVGLSLALAGSSAGPTNEGEQTGAYRVAQDGPEVDNTVTRVELAADASARWSVTIRTRLRNESDVEDYEAFQDRFRSSTEESLGRFERRMTGVVSNAANATGRQMAATDFRAETSIQEVPRRWGVVTYSFTWTNFAVVDGETILLGDVFQGGLYLEADDQLTLVAPSGYVAAEVTPSPDEVDGSASRWFGPHSFADEQPIVRYEPSSATVRDDGGTSSRWWPTGDGTAVVAVAILALLVVGSAVAWRRNGGRPVVGPIGDRDAEDDVTDDEGVSDESQKSPGDGLEPGLLTDEDRVTKLLDRNGGRMRQADVADDLGWSASKTSRVVSGMADEGSIEKLRIGRENVIDLVRDDETVPRRQDE